MAIHASAFRSYPSARAVLREDQDDHGDQNDQEDGLLTMVLFVALGLCIIVVLAEFRA